MRNPFQLFLLIVLIAIGVVLGVLNPHTVTLNLPGYTFTLPLSVVMALALVTGMLLVGLSMLSSWLAWRWQLRKAQRTFKQCEQEKLRLRQQLHELRHDLTLAKAANETNEKTLPNVRS